MKRILNFLSKLKDNTCNTICWIIGGKETDPQIKKYNCIIVFLVLFSVMYVSFMYLRIEKTGKNIIDHLPQMIQNSSNVIHPQVLSNLPPIKPSVNGTNQIIADITIRLGDIVVVRYFGNVGIVTRIPSASGMAEILYKDNRHQIHRIQIELELLTKATPAQMNPWILSN